MFSKHRTSRATVSRGSAVEMELKRGRLHLSVFEDGEQEEAVQRCIDREARVREGACRLLAACSQRDQALEAAKSLHTCSTRILTLMTQLQRLREAQALRQAGRRASDGGGLDERLPCTGKLAISDIRIPLMWKDSEYFKNKGELHRCAMFCLLQVGSELQDTELVLVDRTLTDICFDETFIFTDVAPGFELRVELYSCDVQGEGGAGSAPRKIGKRSGSLGRSSGRKIRAAMETATGCGPMSNGTGTSGGASPVLLPALCMQGPKYHLLAHTSLSLSHAHSSFRTHNLTLGASEDSSHWLPLYGSMCCRVVVQPRCMTEQVMAGSLRVRRPGDDSTSWMDMYVVLRGTDLICYHREEDPATSEGPAFTISVNKGTHIRATERDPALHTQSISIRNQVAGTDTTHTLLAPSPEHTHRWMETFWQHFYDMSQWKQCSDELMRIEQPSKPSAVTFKQGSLFHEMVTPSSSQQRDASLQRAPISAEVRSLLSSYHNDRPNTVFNKTNSNGAVSIP